MRKLNDKSDDNYHVAFLNPKTGELIGEERQFKTLEEVLGFLHNFVESAGIRERMLACLIDLRDGVSEVTIHTKISHVGNQILRITPTEEFHKLFWKGSEL